LGFTYNVYKKYTTSGNVNYNALTANPNPDVFLTGFNTPKWVTNLTFGNREVVKTVGGVAIGFNVVWRWQDNVYWESTLANGQVPAIHTVDAQTSLTLPKSQVRFKLGGSNIFNHRYIQYAAGPTIGGLYYMAITYDITRF
jgi:hypothetical protein